MHSTGAPKGAMCLGEVFIEVQRLNRSRPGFRISFSRRRITVGTQYVVGIGQTSIGQGVFGIFLERLLKKVDAAANCWFRSPVPIVPALEIKVVCFDTLGRASDPVRSLFVTNPGFAF